jgi:fumarate hydratase subunit alpha
MDIKKKVANALIKASTTPTQDILDKYEKILETETNKNSKWIIELLLENARIAKKTKKPLCDDTGIPHILIETGKNTEIPLNLFQDIQLGIKKGLTQLPARPMAVKGDSIKRMEQKEGLYEDPSELEPAPIFIDTTSVDKIKIHILMLGGGPEIRAKTYGVFHKRNYKNITNEIINHLTTEIPSLGCTPSIPAIGIGRTHYEANTLLIKAMAKGLLNNQSDLENEITTFLNKTNIGPLNMGGKNTVLGTFIKIGPQRASGVRIVAIRPCCCVEPRRASITI